MKVQRPARFGFNTFGQVIPVPVPAGFNQRNVTLIVAAGIDRAIGKNDGIPWRLPPDMQQFKRLTTGHPVIMGGNTWRGLPDVDGVPQLKDRANIVITRNPDAVPELPNLASARSLEEALAMCGDRQIFIIGGQQIYEQALHYGMFDDIILTVVHQETPGAEAFFPHIDFKDFLEHSFSTHMHGQIKFEYIHLRMKKKENIEEV